jgi:hypothetical protein
MSGAGRHPVRKVFGIGLSRTGTTSLAAALHRLGYRTVHFPDPGPLLVGDFSVFDAVDAATDTPVTALFPLLDQRYPGSRFVLTVREIDGWLESVEDLFRRRPEGEEGPVGEIRRLVYGRVTFDRAHFRAACERHVAWVRQYFADRPGDLLEMDIAGGEGWEALCAFLGARVPAGAFPRANRRVRAGERFYARTIVGPGLPFGRLPGAG